MDAAVERMHEPAPQTQLQSGIWLKDQHALDVLT